MAHPPGSDTSAAPKRASNGPSTRIDARMVFTSWYGAKYSLMVEASTSIRILSSMVTDTPMRPSNSIMVVTSCRCGTFDTVTGPSARRQPANIGSVAFLAPAMRISPSSGMPPCICSLSTFLPRIFIRREHLQRERMDFAPHRRAERGVHQLMALHRPLADECRCNHHRLEMHIVIALHQRPAAG